MTIQNLDLHDATLKDIVISWAESKCVLRVATATFPDCEIVFSEFSEIIIPRVQPWGPSSSINSFVENAQNQYDIEMQSGDVIRIVASKFSINTN